MNPKRKLSLLLLVSAILAALAVPATAADSKRASGQATDPRGDAPAEGDLLRASGDYFRRGKLRINVSVTDLAAAASRETALGAFFAKYRGGKCRTEVAGTALAYESDTGKAERAFVERKGEIAVTGPASARVKGDKVTLTTSAGELARRGYDCAEVVALATDGEETEELDRISLRLR